MNNTSIQRVLIAALGGEGGGVLADWLVSCARASGLAVQATSVPGVAQRTGATSYYVEWSALPVAQEQKPPVFALSPMPGRVDVVVASEALEGARMMERGFVTPDRTCLITSTSRAYTTVEKMHMEDGRFDSERIHTLAKTLARQAILMDMEVLTQQHQTVVSAVMFGALSGAGTLPWPVEICEAVIQASGKGVQASLAGFHAARRVAQASTSSQSQHVDSTQWPESLQTVVELGAERCRDYQDAAYEALFRRHIEQIPAFSLNDPPALEAWTKAARHLALWMCYEDVIRVADLKTRPERIQRVRQEAMAAAHELVYITEHFKPGIDEVASILPSFLGRRLLHWAARMGKTHLHIGLHIRSTSLWGYLMLRSLSRLRPWRRRSLRYSQEHAALASWWSAMLDLTPRSAAFGAALAGLPHVLKGYGDTQRRGRESYERIWNEQVQPVLGKHTDLDQAASHLTQSIQGALADPEGQLNKQPREQKIRWFKKIPN
jgi:indolepyruvate ferredoxin oxidoreductase beta subunit